MQASRESKISKRTAGLLNAAFRDWYNQLHVWYPNLHTETYFFPPLHFNKVPYKELTIAGQSVLVPQKLVDKQGKNQQSSLENNEEKNNPDKLDPKSSKKIEESVSDRGGEKCAIAKSGNKACATKTGTKPAKSKPVEKKASTHRVPQPTPALASSMWPLNPDISTKKLALPVMPSDVRDDVAHRLVLQYLHCLADDLQEAMFIISHLDFANYLIKGDNKHSKAIASLSRATNLPNTPSGSGSRQGRSDRSKDDKEKRGDFDVLIIHPKHGLIIGEVKSVGGNPEHMKDNPEEAIAKKVGLAVKQLRKSETMLKHLISDVKTPVCVTKTLMLPNLTQQQLLQALQADRNVAEELCKCLGVQDVKAAVWQCLCHHDIHGNLCPSSSCQAVSEKASDGTSEKTIECVSGGISEKIPMDDSVKVADGDFENTSNGEYAEADEGDTKKRTEGVSTKTLKGKRPAESVSEKRSECVYKTTSEGVLEKTYAVVSEKPSEHALNEASDMASENTTNSALDKASKKVSEKPAENTNDSSSNKASNKASKKASEKPAENTGESGSEDCVAERSSYDWSWWRRVVQSNGSQDRMERELYNNLVARFGGPATTIEIPTVTPPRGEQRSTSQAIAHTGLVMARLTLYPDQVDILFKDDPLVFLTGPPGTGKSIVLAVKGLMWLRRGKDVHLVISHVDGQAVSFLMRWQLECLTEGSAARVFLHKYFLHNDAEVKTGVDQLAAIARERTDGELYVIADEISNYRFEDFCTMLLDQVPGLHLWAATVQEKNGPTCLAKYVLTAPLRCPPVVEKEVSKSREMGKSVVRFGKRPCPAPTEGPEVMRLLHKKQEGHRAGPPENCERCGEEIARILKEKIVPGQSDLQYRDVLLICQNPKSDKGLVKALLRGGIPLKVVAESDVDEVIRHDDVTPHDAVPASRDDVIESLALAKDDEMIVTSYTVVQGLERMIVIGMGDQNFGNSGLDQLYSMSRCTSQLIWIGNQ